MSTQKNADFCSFLSVDQRSSASQIRFGVNYVSFASVLFRQLLLTLVCSEHALDLSRIDDERLSRNAELPRFESEVRNRFIRRRSLAGGIVVRALDNEIFRINNGP